jgi:hypothetical protein
MVNPNAIMIIHMSKDMDIPMLSYSDAYVDGEQFRYLNSNGSNGYMVKTSYLNVFSLDQFRAEFMGKQWGIIPFFLPELSPNDKDKVQPTQGLATLLLLHDVQPWTLWSNMHVWDNMYQALDSFQFEKALFIPYYDNAPSCIVHGSNDVYVSAYKRNGGDLLIIGNLSPKREKIEATVNLPRLGISHISSVFSLVSHKEVGYNKNDILLSVDGMDYDLLWIK